MGSIFAFKALVGLGASPCDSVVELSATDLFFQHERSTAISSLILALYAVHLLDQLLQGTSLIQLVGNGAFMYKSLYI